MAERIKNHEFVVPNAHCYLSVRIANSQMAFQLQDTLEELGIRVNNPCNIDLVNSAPTDMPNIVGQTCYNMMDNSASIVVIYSENPDDMRRIGRDCATEIGYTIGKNKPIYILVNEGTLVTARQRLTEDLPIHHFDIDENHITDNVEHLIEMLNPLITNV